RSALGTWARVSVRRRLAACLLLCRAFLRAFFFFFPAPATPQIYTLSLHDALPISTGDAAPCRGATRRGQATVRNDARRRAGRQGDRKSTRLNSSHVEISYAVFCLKKKKKIGAAAWERGTAPTSPARADVQRAGERP